MTPTKFPSAALGILVVLVLFLGACGSSDDSATPSGDTSSSTSSDDTATSSGTSSDDTATSDDTGSADDTDDENLAVSSSDGPAPGDSFCDVAQSYEENDPLQDVDIQDGVENFYTEALAIWADLIERAPAQIQGDLGVIRSVFEDQRDIAAQFNFDLANPELSQAIGTMDMSAAEDAQNRLDSYLFTECGIAPFSDNDSDPSGSGENELGNDENLNLDGDLEARVEAGDPAAVLIALFGADPDTAQCLVDELGLETGSGLADMDSSRVTESLCGTTMLDVMSGG